MENITVDVEYCGTCGYGDKFKEFEEYIAKECPNIKVEGRQGRRATFEVKVNGTLVHSKLNTFAFPDYKDVTSILNEVSEGKGIRKVNVHQPITNCIVL